MKFLLLTLAVAATSCTSATHTQPTFKGANMHASDGKGYIDSMNAALHAPHLLLARDLTDEEMDEADNRPGRGYSDGKWTGENPPQDEDEDGNPAYSANGASFECFLAIQHVWEDDNGTIIILEDDGEITEVTPDSHE